MPTRKGGPRQPRQRIERPVADESQATPRRASAEAAAARGPAKAVQRNPLFPVGVTLYPLDAETQGADEWYAREADADLESLAEARCALTRVFVSWRVLEPQVGQYDEEGLDRLASLIEAARARKVQTIVCFFADDRHAELSEVAWGKRRDPRTDQYLVQRESALVAKVVGRLRGEPGVFAWQLGNEAFLSEFESHDALREWVDALREAIREHDPTRPIGLGADPETLFRATGVDARDVIEACEFSVSHVTSSYRAYAAQGPLTSGPSTYLDSFLLRNAHRGRPVLMDEVGVQSLEHSPQEEAAYLRSALWSGFMNRAGGAMARRLRDMDVERREPYFLDPFETLVGLADAEGLRKPAFAELRAFVRTISRIDLSTHSLIQERTAILVPDERFAPLPSLAGLFGPRACFHAYMIAKQAQVPVTVMREDDPFDGLQVLVVPSAFSLEPETWTRVSEFVQGGGTLLMSYGGGDVDPAAFDLFGTEFLGDGGPRSTLSCRVAHQDILGSLQGFDAAFDVPNMALLSGGTATIVATDATGSPLLTVNQAGQGRAVYCAVPLERAIAQGDPWATPAPVRSLARELYGAVARGAGAGAPVTCDSPHVELALFQGDTDDVLVALNHADERLDASLTIDRRVASIADVRGGSPVAVGGPTFSVSLEANAATALRLTYA